MTAPETYEHLRPLACTWKTHVGLYERADNVAKSITSISESESTADWANTGRTAERVGSHTLLMLNIWW